MTELAGRARVVFEGVRPEIDCGRFPIKRVVGEEVEVEADIFADGHEVVVALLLWRHEDNPAWTELPMEFLVNDRWRGRFAVTEPGCYRYTLTGWVDRFMTWQQKLSNKARAGQDVSVELLTGADLVEEAAGRAPEADAGTIKEWAGALRSAEVGDNDKVILATSSEVTMLMERYPDRRFATVYHRELDVLVDRQKARFSTWYEMFPRSCIPEPGRHGTFRDCESRLSYISKMGFDVLYLPPVHPIGQAFRKGKNNSLVAGPCDPGTPWAIGSDEGGHKAIHPELGTLEDFRHLLDRARDFGIEIAIDLAFQCAPDHPYIREHPEWFQWRPDGTIQYAENPPKKYQDIYPLDFETGHWFDLWQEMKSVVLFWIEQGVRIFRVDNPHTKPFAFWEWLLGGLRKDYPDLIFLSEAFTRPKVMYRLAKIGFNQSYTYFAWRNSRWDFTQYFTELTRTDVKEYFRPSLWTNTPDILTEYLQKGGRPAFMTRLVLAATLGASYGIYGPAFELCERTPREPGSEEYLDSEKYEIKYWDIYRPDSLSGFIGKVNHIRRENPALQSDSSLRFYGADNEQLLCYSKQAKDLANLILVVVNLDYRNRQSGWVDLPMEEMGIDPAQPYRLHDLLAGVTYQWSGSHNFVTLDPAMVPAHIFRVEQL